MNNQELRIEILLEEVVKKRASDLHIQVGLPPMLRIDGALVPAAGTQPLDEPAVERLVFQILDEDQRQILLKDKEFDFSFAFGTLGRFRVNAFHERGNLAAALRLIPNEIKSASELGMPPVVNSFADFPRGYSGRAGLYEVMDITEEIQNLIVKRATSAEIQRMAIQQGMITMRQDGYLKALNGITTIEEVNRVAADTA